ncbi:peptide deformylase 2 [Candidatus Vecturithrix granuli]|uniref:Peptide deformylase n=1 Tax=Vecturithrix granuli TaxID=1499967 RepID=A0A081BUV8_VECG1|nr:peptide deformylase 2 [Candidatus Vecturithrix granuli]
MPVREILQLGNPILWEHSAPIEDVFAEDTLAVIRDLDETLADFHRTHGFGRAIAAPQIGYLKRILFVRMQPTGFCGALINPIITSASDEQIELWDDCFSFPDLLVKVKRAKEIEVAYLDQRNQPQIIHAEGDFSELLQHEIDHLDGILSIQRAISSTSFSTRQEWERAEKANNRSVKARL